MAQLQAITYRGHTVAAATRSRFFLGDELERRPADDPECTFVIFMCAYAGNVLDGVLPGPYTELAARRYARACLIPAELLEHADLEVARAARALQLPAEELRTVRAEHAAEAVTAAPARRFAGYLSAPPSPPRAIPLRLLAQDRIAMVNSLRKRQDRTERTLDGGEAKWSSSQVLGGCLKECPRQRRTCL